MIKRMRLSTTESSETSCPDGRSRDFSLFHTGLCTLPDNYLTILFAVVTGTSIAAVLFGARRSREAKGDARALTRTVCWLVFTSWIVLLCIYLQNGFFEAASVAVAFANANNQVFLASALRLVVKTSYSSQLRNPRHGVKLVNIWQYGTISLSVVLSICLLATCRSPTAFNLVATVWILVTTLLYVGTTTAFWYFVHKCQCNIGDILAESDVLRAASNRPHPAPTPLEANPTANEYSTNGSHLAGAKSRPHSNVERASHVVQETNLRMSVSEKRRADSFASFLRRLRQFNALLQIQSLSLLVLSLFFVFGFFLSFAVRQYMWLLTLFISIYPIHELILVVAFVRLSKSPVAEAEETLPTKGPRSRFGHAGTTPANSAAYATPNHHRSVAEDPSEQPVQMGLVPV